MAVCKECDEVKQDCKHIAICECCDNCLMCGAPAAPIVPGGVNWPYRNPAWQPNFSEYERYEITHDSGKFPVAMQVH